MTDTRHSFNRNESVIPRQPSNRRLIEQMKAWGWIEGKTGKYLTMKAPVGDETVGVQPANKHDANATSIFLAIYRLTTQGDADLFWRGPSDLWIEMLKEQRAADARKKEAHMHEQPRGQQAVPTTPMPAVARSVEPAAPPVGSTKRPAYFTGKKYSSTKSVLEVLAASPNRSMDAEAICKKLGLDPTVEAERRSVSNTLSLLYKNGQVRRMKIGSYRCLTPPPQEMVLTADNQLRPVTPIIFDPPVDGVTQNSYPISVTHATVPATALINNSVFMALKPAEESVDDVIEAVLDLLLPGGFKAQDLRVITPWIEATKKMVGTVAR